jgi:hypothetical protein
LGKQIEELVELRGDGANRRRSVAMSLRGTVEPGQHRHRQTVVVVVTLRHQLAVAVDAVDDAVARAT